MDQINRNNFFDAAWNIGCQLMKSSIWHGDSCNWQGYSFEPLDGKVARLELLDDPLTVGVVLGVASDLAGADSVQRRLGNEEVPVLDHLWHVPVEERHQQRRDVVAVGVGVHQQEHLAVAELARVEVRADAAAERRHDVLQLLVGEQLGGVRLLGVEHLAAQRQDRLGPPVAALLGRATRRVALDDEQLALARVGRRAVGELAGQVEPVRHRGLAGHRRDRRARRLARLRRQDQPVDHRLAPARVLVEPALEAGPGHA